MAKDNLVEFYPWTFTGYHTYEEAEADIAEAILSYKDKVKSKGLSLIGKPFAMLQPNLFSDMIEIIVRGVVKPKPRTKSNGTRKRQSNTTAKLFGEGSVAPKRHAPDSA